MPTARFLRHCIVAALLGTAALGCATAGADSHASDPARAFATNTPIKHIVVIFQENVSFDHYFATYPVAANPAGEPAFQARAGTPSVNGLGDFLLNHNPNSANPARLDRSQPLTCDQDHNYGAEQKAFDGGLMDKFVQFTDVESCGAPDIALPGLVMDYYDGNTVTALWNYAQHFALSDNSYGTVFGPSTPGAINLIAGQTHGATLTGPAGSVANGTDIGDQDPSFDDCSNPNRPTLSLSGRNIGDLLNAKGISWGWFQGGFRPTGVNSSGKAVCGAITANVGGANIPDYSPHHEPFQYYASTSNPHHLAPSSVSAIGGNGQANHQYDLQDFWAAAKAGNLPAVSFLKAKEAQDGHAGYSDPLDEQQFIVNTINQLEQLPTWSSTAVVIAYDDSDGWYDHVMGPIVNQSADPANDALDGAGLCGTNSTGVYQDRCGYGPRLPLLVISGWAKDNAVDHSVTNQSSILRFIEDNWQTGRIGDDSFDAKSNGLDSFFDFSRQNGEHRLFLDPNTGLVVEEDSGEQ
ncbi:MAG: phospholipase C [Bacillota bacterium]